MAVEGLLDVKWGLVCFGFVQQVIGVIGGQIGGQSNDAEQGHGRVLSG